MKAKDTIQPKEDNTGSAITKSEAERILRLIRKREVTQKSMIVQRSAKIIAEAEAKIARKYSITWNPEWEEKARAICQAVAELNAIVKADCAQDGTPEQFAPSMDPPGWNDRGENGIAKRRVELRKVLMTRVESIQQSAFTEIERQSLQAQTEVTLLGLESPAAKAFLSAMAPPETLLPPVDVPELEKIFEARLRREKDERHSYLSY